MPDPTSYQNGRSGSTTWGLRRVKIAAARKGTAGAQRPPSRSLPAARALHDGPVTITVEWKGGAESWWHVKARGRRWVFPGWVAIEDVIAGINDPAGTGWWPVD